MNEFRDLHGLLNQFWQMRRSAFFTSLEADLYYALVDEANTRRWIETFSISNGWLTAKIGTSEPSLIRARNKLKQCGLIEFKSGKTKRQPSKYSLTYVTNYLNNFSSGVSRKPKKESDYLNNFSSNVSESVSSNVSQSVRQVKTKDIRHKNNTNNNKDFEKNNFEEENYENENPIVEEPEISELQTEIIPSKKVATKKVSQNVEVEALPLPFESPNFKEVWTEFREYRQKEKKNPVTVTSAKKMFKSLAKYDESTAVKALDLAMERGWTGVFPENVANQIIPKNKIQTKNVDFENADYSRTTLK